MSGILFFYECEHFFGKAIYSDRKARQNCRACVLQILLILKTDYDFKRSLLGYVGLKSFNLNYFFYMKKQSTSTTFSMIQLNPFQIINMNIKFWMTSVKHLKNLKMFSDLKSEHN